MALVMVNNWAAFLSIFFLFARGSGFKQLMWKKLSFITWDEPRFGTMPQLFKLKMFVSRDGL